MLAGKKENEFAAVFKNNKKKTNKFSIIGLTDDGLLLLTFHHNHKIINNSNKCFFSKILKAFSA